jgi:arsenite-transporting ATPase
MFCGKGGGGKTTAASSTALHFALQGKKTLLISTDPSPSLSDILEIDVSEGLMALEEIGGLDAVELDYDCIVELWKEKYGGEVYDVISSFLPVDEEIIDYVAGAPGMDEEFALSYVYDLYVSGDYEVIVWDTAPAGGTLSLLKLQDTFYKHLGDAARLYVRFRKAIQTLTSGKARRDPLKIISEWETLSKNVLEMIRNKRTIAFLVTIPEALGVNQTRRVARDLEKFGINIGGVIINNYLTPEAANSDFHRRRRNMQLKYIEELEKTYGEIMPLVKLPLMPFEIKGLDSLKEIEKKLFP